VHALKRSDLWQEAWLTRDLGVVARASRSEDVRHTHAKQNKGQHEGKKETGATSR
jgi:hypothetical protein